MGAGLWPEGMPAPPAQVPRQAARPAVARAPGDELPPLNPLVGVEWTISYVGLLAFVFAMVTYALPIGQGSIIVALIGLLVQRQPLRVPLLLKGLLAFLLWCAVGLIFTDWPDVVQEALLNLGKIWLIALVAANALRTRPQIRFFLFFYLACFAFYPVRGALFNYFIYGQTTFGRAIWQFVYVNPNDLAAYCLLMLALALALYQQERKSMLKLGALMGVFVLPFLVLLTKSRGAFLAMSAFTLLLVAGGRKRLRAAIITVFVGAVVVLTLPASTLERLTGLGKLTSTATVHEADEEGSAFQRYTIWKVARRMIAEQPIAGVGLGAYPSAHWHYAQRPQFDPTARGMRDTHSTYLNVMAETGVIGFLIYALTYGATLVGIMRVRRRSRQLLPLSSQALYVQVLGVLAFYVAGIFGSVAHVSFLILQVTAVWAFSRIVEDDLARTAAPPRNAEPDYARLFPPVAGQR